MKAHLIVRSWVTSLWKNNLRRPVRTEAVPLSEVLRNAIKMQAVTMGSKIRYI